VPYLRKTATNTLFIPMSYKDNAYLSEDYVNYLLSLKGDLGRAWRDGDWDVFEGQAFPQWNQEDHVIRLRDFQGIPEHWMKWRAIDWGYNAPFCCLWFARDPDSRRIIIYREVYGKGLTVPQQARLIKDSTPPNESIQITYADPSMWASNSVHEVITPTAQEYANNGLFLTKADNNRLSGKRKVDELLACLPDGMPGVQVVENCENLIRTMPLMICAEKNPEDIDTTLEDHCLIAGTLIETINGEKAIETVKQGDFVLTRKGFKEVTRSWLTTKNAVVYKVTFSDGNSLVGTAKHPVFVENKGFVSIENLMSGDVVTKKESILWLLMLSNSMELNSDDTLNQITEHAVIITHQMEPTDTEGLVSYIKKYGKMLMDQFQVGITFITRITTSSITTLQTLNVYRHLTTYHNTQKNIRDQKNTWNESDHLQPYGTSHLKVESGTESMQQQWKCKTRNLSANIAEKSLLEKCKKIAISVLGYVGLLNAARKVKTILKRLALFVEKYLCRISTQNNKCVPQNVVQVIDVQKLNKQQDVFNLVPVRNKWWEIRGSVRIN